MDLNGDGHRDVLTGSWPGELYLFAGRADGTFAKGETLKDADGDAYSWSASVPFAVDWDRDGDLDVVVGDIAGAIHFIPNSSGDTSLKLGESTALRVGESAIKVPGGDSGPVIADWDGDGNHDLLVGCGNGEVQLFRNTTADGVPTLAAATSLVDASASYPGNETDAATSPCGSRAKIAVADYNADGKLDLLLGDFSMKDSEKRELSPEEKTRMAELTAKQQEMMPKLMAAMAAGRMKILKDLGIDDPSNIPEDKEKAADAAFRKLMETEPVKAVIDELNVVMEELGGLKGQPTAAGHVWVFARA